MEWYYRASGNQMGPLSEADFKELAADGRIYADTLVWHDGMIGWQQFRELSDDDRPVVTDTCEHCQGMFAETRLLSITDRRVCYRCKPYYVQQIKEIGFVRKRKGISIMTRFWAAVIDSIFISMFMGGTLFFMGIVAGFLGLSTSGGFGGVTMVLGFVLMCLVPFIYLTVSVGWRGGSPGKLMCGLKVVMSDGGKVSYRRAFMRSLGATLSPVLLFIPWLMAAFDDNGQAMHDRLCNTKVVKS